MRGRNHRGGGGGGGGPIRHHSGAVPLNRNHVFDSNGPDMRMRGTSQQLFEKYLQLGRDATSSGDRVMAESYFQHAEHYFRILNAMNQAAQQNQGNGQNGQQPRRQYQPDEQGQMTMNGEAEEMDQRMEPQRNEPQRSEPQRVEPQRVEPQRVDRERPAGTGDQPEPREIPISAAPLE